MKNSNFLFHVLTEIGLPMLIFIVFFSSCKKDQNTQPDLSSTDLITVPLFVVTDDNQMPTSNDQLLFESRKNNPLLAPDGHHLTWGEFNSVKGQSSNK